MPLYLRTTIGIHRLEAARGHRIAGFHLGVAADLDDRERAPTGADESILVPRSVIAARRQMVSVRVALDDPHAGRRYGGRGQKQAQAQGSCDTAGVRWRWQTPRIVERSGGSTAPLHGA